MESQRERSKNNLPYPAFLLSFGNRKELMQNIQLFFSCVDNLVDRLQELTPPEFNEEWINIHLSVTHKKFKVLLQKSNNKIEWAVLVASLPAEWQGRWTGKVLEVSASFLDCVNQITQELAVREPKTFGPAWLKKNLSKLFWRLKPFLYKESKKIDWKVFEDELPEKWKKRWSRRTMSKFSFDDCIEEIVKKLEEKKPSKVNPRWISLNLPNISGKLRRSYLLSFKRGNNLNWDLIYDGLPKKWQKKWEQQRKNEYIDVVYSDQKEVDDFLKKHENKMYTVHWPLNTEDKFARREIIDGLVFFAKGGNVDAKNFLVKELMHVCLYWAEKKYRLRGWMNRQDKLAKEIERCIFCYNLKKSKGAFFYTYLFSSLKKIALSFPGDRKYKDAGQGKSKRNSVEYSMD